MLKQEYLLRKGSNDLYSKAAFARDLGLHQAKLIQILNGTTGISPDRAVKVAEQINFPDEEEELFLTLVEVEHARSPSVRQRAAKRLNIILEDEGHREKIEALQVFKKWYHIAVLNLLPKNSTINNREISERLGITADPTEIEIMKSQIRRFIKSFDRKFSCSTGAKTELYQTMLQFYPITKSK